MVLLPGRPSLDELVDELRPLDIVWDPVRECPGIVVDWDIDGIGLGDFARAFTAVERWQRDGTRYLVFFLGAPRPTELAAGVAGVLPRLREPQTIRAALAALLHAAPVPADPSPVLFDCHAVVRAEAPALWRLLATFRDWRVELATIDVVRTFLWAGYLSIVDVRKRFDDRALLYHLSKAGRVVRDFRNQPNPVLALLGEAARDDLEAAVEQRLRADAEIMLSRLAAGAIRAATPAGEGRARREAAAAWIRIRAPFGEYPHVLRRVQSDLEERFAAVYRVLT